MGNAKYKELSLVRLIQQVGDVPVGTVGTVVHVYPGGKAYEVEFTVGNTIDDHWHAVEMVEDVWLIRYVDGGGLERLA